MTVHLFQFNFFVSYSLEPQLFNYTDIVKKSRSFGAEKLPKIYWSPHGSGKIYVAKNTCFTSAITK